MYKALIEGVDKRISDLTKYTDDTLSQHHQVRGRLMEASEMRNWLIASAAADAQATLDSKAAKPKKGSKAPKAKATKAPASLSNVTPLKKKEKKTKAVVTKPQAAPANG